MHRPEAARCLTVLRIGSTEDTQRWGGTWPGLWAGGCCCLGERGSAGAPGGGRGGRAGPDDAPRSRCAGGLLDAAACSSSSSRTASDGDAAACTRRPTRFEHPTSPGERPLLHQVAALP